MSPMRSVPSSTRTQAFADDEINDLGMIVPERVQPSEPWRRRFDMISTIGCHDDQSPAFALVAQGP